MPDPPFRNFSTPFLFGSDWNYCRAASGTLLKNDSSSHSDIKELKTTGSEEHLVEKSHIEAALWKKRFSGTGHESGNPVQQTSDGGYIIAGMKTSFGQGKQVYMVKTGPKG
ncbi:MAG TPA: hypothetical protein PKY15_00510 [Methanoregulaceae archaeon]|jgi:hypothetical protein|nr:hypothetical protein [Methanoregulaceae archaeon]HQC11822.1 hypothetical protein [Methanoregulaceae archaeon]